MVRFILFLVLVVSGHPFLISHQAAALQSSFVLEFKKVVAAPDEYVRVPLMLSSSTDSIGGWNILVTYDTSAGRVVDVELCDSVLIEDSLWVYAPWITNPDLSRPEYFEYTLNVQGHQDWVRVVGIMDMPDPTTVPGLPPGDGLMLLCLAYDISPHWGGEDVDFGFQTNGCGDNTLSDLSGYHVWGPDTASAPPSTCPERSNAYRSIRLNSGAGIGASTGVADSGRFDPSQPFGLTRYPNPFFRSTCIRFALPEDGHVAVRIYNIAGELVETLLERVMQKGQHSMTWNADGTSAGVYFCQIELTTSSNKKYRATEKMTLVR